MKKIIERVTSPIDADHDYAVPAPEQMIIPYADAMAGMVDLNCEYRRNGCDTDWGDYGSETDPNNVDESDLEDWWTTTWGQASDDRGVASWEPEHDGMQIQSGFIEDLYLKYKN